jgi:predicted DNA-binding antitoxin AbrB/MazE fold protein
MPKTIEAIYENGVLKPSDHLPLKNHQHVHIIIESYEKDTGIPETIEELLKLPIGALSRYAINNSMGVGDFNDADID